MPLTRDETQRLRKLEALVAKARRRAVTSLDREGLRELPRLYRFACSLLARLETRGENPGLRTKLRSLVNDSHGVLFQGVTASPSTYFARLATFFLADCPRTLRAEWKVLTLAFVAFYGLAVTSFYLVDRDLDLAYSLLDPGMVQTEIEQLEATPEGQPFVGNFDFLFGKSPATAAFLMFHNIRVGLLIFASALIPPLYLYIMANNGLMLGTYLGVASHWDQASSMSTILVCHGTLELQAIVLAGAAGMILMRAIVAPGPWTRRQAMRVESRRAWRVLAPMFPMLVCAGIIEGFISPHADVEIRLAVAGTTGLMLLVWLLFGGRAAKFARQTAQP